MDPTIVILAGGISSRMNTGIDGARSKAMIGVGADRRPFLDYLLGNVERAGYRDVCIVIGDRDDSIRRRYESDMRSFPSLTVSFAVQSIPPGRSKPPGTADALLSALRATTRWAGRKFTVCNSDNLYSVTALRLLLEDQHPNAMIDYDRSALNFSRERIAQFAVIRTSAGGAVEGIIEKPSDAEIAQAADPRGRIGVSMNIFRFSCEMIIPFLESVPLHPVRNEKELPVAVSMMIRRYPGTLHAIPLSEHVPDLTTPDDVPIVMEYLRRDGK